MASTVAKPVDVIGPLKELPTFSSVDEEVEFWMTHDSSPYWDQMEDVTDSPPPEWARGRGRAGSAARRRPAPDATEELTVRLSAEGLTVRLSAEVVEVMRAKARLAGVSLDDLADTWLRDRMLEECRQAMAAVR